MTVLKTENALQALHVRVIKDSLEKTALTIFVRRIVTFPKETAVMMGVNVVQASLEMIAAWKSAQMTVQETENVIFKQESADAKKDSKEKIVGKVRN